MGIKIKLKFITCLSVSTFIYIFMSVNNFKINAIVKKIFFINENKTQLIRTQRLPSALIVGAAKCGTSALIEFLSVHPQVAATVKEIDYFSNDINYNQSIKWYREQMPVSNQNQITIEKTPAYLVGPNAAERVFNLNPNMKLILSLEPYHIICIQK